MKLALFPMSGSTALLWNDARDRAKLPGVMHLGDRSRVGNDLSDVVRRQVQSGLSARLHLYILATTSWTFSQSEMFTRPTVHQNFREATTTARFYMDHYLSRLVLNVLGDFWTTSHPQADLWYYRLLETDGPASLLQLSLSG